MLPYILIFFLIVFLNIFKDKNKHYRKVMIILFLFAALRGNGDGDYFNYKIYSKYICTIKDVYENRVPMEIGFRIISYINNKLSLDSQWVIIAMNCLSLYCMTLFFKLRSKIPLLSILLFFPYYLQFDMHASRSAVAVSFGCIAIHYLLDSKLIKYLIFCILATLFHSSAIILLAIILFKDIRMNFYLEILIMLLSLFWILNFSLDSVVINSLNSLGLLKLGYRYQAYTVSENFGYAFKLYDPRLILNIIIYLMIRIPIKYNRKKDEAILSNIFFIAIILTILLSEHTVFITRIISYFSIVTTILIPNKICKIKNYILLFGTRIRVSIIYKLFFISSYFLFNMVLIIKMVPYRFYTW